MRSKLERRAPIRLRPLRRAPLYETGTILDFEPFEREASKALGLPYYKDVLSGHANGIYHRLGSFLIKDAETAFDAVVKEYLKWTGSGREIYTFREYVHACQHIDNLRSQLARIRSWELEEDKIEDEYRDRRLAADGGRHVTRPRHPFPTVTLDTRDQTFARQFSREHNTADRAGYLSYLRLEAPDLYNILERDVPLFIKEDPDKPHAYLLGASGSGKTELLKLLIHTFVTEPRYGSVVVLDPSSDFASEAAPWKEFIGSDRLIYVRPKLAAGMTPVINPFEISGVHASDYSERAIDTKLVVAQELVNALERVIIEGSGSLGLTLNMQSILTPCVLTLLDRQGSTLEDLERFMRKETNADLVEFGASLAHHEGVARFFREGFHDGAISQTKLSIYRKINWLLQRGTFARLTCGMSTIDLEGMIDARKVIVFDLGKGAIGGEEGRAFGRLIVAMLLGIALRRGNKPKHRRIPCSLVIDECHNYITESMEEILVEARKYRLLLTLSQQVAGFKMELLSKVGDAGFRRRVRLAFLRP